MPDPGSEPARETEQELGARIAAALQNKADSAEPAGRASTEGRSLAREARRRVHKRRQTLLTSAAAVVLAVAVGGVWAGADRPSVTAGGESAASGAAAGSGKANDSVAEPNPATQCPADHLITRRPDHEAVPPGVGLTPGTQVTGLQACRYRIKGGVLLGSASFDAAKAQQVVEAITRLPERNPDLPVFRCTASATAPREAIVLRFTTAAGIREIWVGYDGCVAPGFFTGGRTYGLYAAPLRLFLTGSVRPAGGTYLDALPGW